MCVLAYKNKEKINLWCYSPEEPRLTVVVAARWQYREPCGYQRTYPSTLISVFLTEFSLLLISSSYPIVLTRLGGPRSKPYTPEKFLGNSWELNPGPLDGSETC